MLIIILCGFIIGYLLNNYTLTVTEEKEGNPIRPIFDKKITPIMLLWNVLVPILLYFMYGGTFTAGFFRFNLTKSK